MDLIVSSFSEKLRRSNYDEKGVVYDDSDVESDVDVTGLESHPSSEASTSCDQGPTTAFNDEPNTSNGDHVTTSPANHVTSDGEDVEFQNFLRELETEQETPNEEEKRLLVGIYSFINSY